MATKTFRTKNVIVNVHNLENLNKERVENLCKEFMARVEIHRLEKESKGK